jgi:hypothetical protein
MSRPLTRREFDQLIKKYGPVSSNTVIRVPGGKASETGELFSKLHVELETDDGLETVDFYATGSCDNGHLVGVDGVEIGGQCGVCGAWVCTRDGCMRMCEKGHVVCGKHACVMHDGTVYCTRHRPFLDMDKLMSDARTIASGTAKFIRWLVR